MKYEKEYAPIAILEGSASRNIRIPKSIIVEKSMMSIRIAVFTYLTIYRGLNNRLCFSIPLFLKWVGYKSDSHSGGINDKVIETLEVLREIGYVTFLGNTPIKRSSCIEIEFNTQLLHEKCFEESFAIMYIDEIETIMHYSNDNSQDRYLNRNTVLLVFAFLRHAIFRTPNELKPEERNPEGIAARRERCIEAYNDNYKNMAAELGLSERTVSLAVQVLVKLELIAKAEAYRIKNEDDEYRTQDIIFANMEKREGKELLAKGKEYAVAEIARKEKRIRKYIPDYRIRTISIIS